LAELIWAEAHHWAESRITAKKYRMPNQQRPRGVAAASPKRLAGRFYQLKTGHCLTGRQHLLWTKNRTTAKCG
jgi:hypothetical protein